MRLWLGRVLAAAICILGLPIHLALVLLVIVSDPGPALYASERIGRNGRFFRLLKYRTMKVAADAIVTEDFQTVVLDSDPRVTKAGRWLRCGIDELPQLWNIVHGEIAWIGPRPDEDWMLLNYGPVIRKRLTVLPGITGLAQVLDSRSLGIAERYAIDLWYLAQQSILLDAWIALVTPAFMAGWREVGARRLAKLRSSAEFQRLCEACAEELERARMPASLKITVSSLDQQEGSSKKSCCCAK